jgi:hypothetical protein
MLHTYMVTFTARVCIAVEARSKTDAAERMRWHAGEEIAGTLDPALLVYPLRTSAGQHDVPSFP